MYALLALPWNIVQKISTISLMTEFRKYIVDFELISWLGFSKKFT